MLISPQVMRLFILLCSLCMAVLAAFYLRGRELSFGAYLRWGMLLVLVPLLGPFLVILAHPGNRRRH